MATLANSVLSVQVNQSTQQATVVVVTDVSFGPGESPLSSRLDCRILGNDPIRDDFLFAFPTRFFTDLGANPSVRFERENVSRSILNEDIIGADEIVGELTLRTGTGPAITKRTNVVQIV
jgi:hypothetical protein